MTTRDNPAPGLLATCSALSEEALRLRVAISEMTAGLCARRFCHHLRAVVLTGSLARNEATWAREAPGWRLLGDAEFFLVFHPSASLPPQTDFDCLQQEVEDNLRRDGILAHVQVVPVYPKYLREFGHDILAYELRACGQVVRGDKSILTLIPDFSAADVSLENAWRLLANRMIEHLEAAAGIETCVGSLPEFLRYRTVKLYLDMATSLLVFVGSYAPTYRERQCRLMTLADGAEKHNGWPFPLGPFAQQVSVSTDRKLNGDWQESAAVDWDSWRQAVRYFQLLWRWELARLSERRQPTPERELMRSWMRRQPFTQRLFGWMFVWRACGWLHSWRWWPHWARLAAGGSPRYWVYSAAASLFSQLPDVLEVHGDRAVPRALCEQVVSDLPVVQGRGWTDGSVRWASVVGEVGRNYHRFLEPTRS